MLVGIMVEDVSTWFIKANLERVCNTIFMAGNTRSFVGASDRSRPGTFQGVATSFNFCFGANFMWALCLDL